MAHEKSKKSRAKANLRNLRAKSVGGKQAGSVKGGKLLEAAVKGKVFKKVEIHGTAS